MVAPCLVDTKAESLVLTKTLTSMVLRAMSSTDLEKSLVQNPCSLSLLLAFSARLLTVDVYSSVETHCIIISDCYVQITASNYPNVQAQKQSWLVTLILAVSSPVKVHRIFEE